MRIILALAFMAMVFCAAPPASAQPANDHLLSPNDLSQVSPHVWMIKGFPNIGIVVGTRATLVIDTGMGTKNGQIVSSAALRLSPRGQKLYLTTTHYHAERATGDGGFPPGTLVIRPRIQQTELEAEGQKLIDLFSSRSEQDKSLLEGIHLIALMRNSDTVLKAVLMMARRRDSLGPDGILAARGHLVEPSHSWTAQGRRIVFRIP